MKNIFLGLTAIGLLGLVAPSQAAKPDHEKQIPSSEGLTLADSIPGIQHPFLKKYLLSLQAEVAGGKDKGKAASRNAEILQDRVANAVRLADDVKNLPADSPWQKTPFVVYPVPAMSAIRRLPDKLPPDAGPGSTLTIVAAQGEFEPTSFVIAPMVDVAKFEIKASDMVSKNGTIPAENIDIKVVKTWWQPGTAWNSYFADPSRRELVPELLLNDENLVKVDMQDQENYLRVDYPEGSKYVWISYLYPEQSKIEGDHRFNYYKEPVGDSPTLLPVRLEAGQNKQFWITVKVPETAAPGIYEGHLSFNADGKSAGQLALKLRVLPFSLPDPKTYYDVNLDFLSTMDDLGSLREELQGFDGDTSKAEARLLRLYKNQRDHNIYNYNGPGILSWNAYKMHQSYTLAAVMENEESKKILTRQLELVGKAGFKPPLINPSIADISARVKMDEEEGREIFDRNIAAAKQLLDLIEKILGHRDVYFWGRGEPSRAGMLEQFEGIQALHSVGVKIGQEAQPWHLEAAGHLEDLVNMGGAHYDRMKTAPWHAVGQRMLSYAGPHPGAENPDMSRRYHGMIPYKSWFDGTKNNTWNPERQNWLDFWNPYGYRINMIYPTQGGVINTLHWEGFREGIDDIRYATKLKLLAKEAIDSGNASAAEEAKKALLWLELDDEKNANLDATRMEMINYILKLQEILNSKGA